MCGVDGTWGVCSSYLKLSAVGTCLDSGVGIGRTSFQKWTRFGNITVAYVSAVLVSSFQLQLG
jgi:hypothetical protein